MQKLTCHSKALERSDLCRVQALLTVSKHLPFEVFLARIRHEQRGSSDTDSELEEISDYGDDPNGPSKFETPKPIPIRGLAEQSDVVDKLYDVDGNEVVANIPVEDAEFVDPDPFAGAKCTARYTRGSEDWISSSAFEEMAGVDANTLLAQAPVATNEFKVAV